MKFYLAQCPLKLLLFKPWYALNSTLQQSGIPVTAHTYLTLKPFKTRGARFIFCNYHRSASASSMKSNLSLPLLSLRRKVSRLSLFHKISYSVSTLKEKLILSPPHTSFRLDHQHKVGIPQFRTFAYLDSFIPRSPSEWNHLPAYLVSISSINFFFKDSITSHFCLFDCLSDCFLSC
uniref:Putative endonuclease/reverse transcript n=1 Tax=Ixodes scapularis TaxID=6945 RepID=A0A4D5RZL7_IXOSC